MNRLFVSQLALLALASLAACGDNLKGTGTDAGAGHHDGAAPADAPSTPLAVVVAPPLNFGPPPGILSSLDVASLTVKQNLAAGEVGADPYLRLYAGNVFIVNRSTGDNVTVLDAKTLEFQQQIGTGSASNPQDAAVVGDKVYVPALGTAGVVVLSLSTGAMTGTIDLNAATGETDGDPDCVSAFVVGTDVYVACDILDENFMPRGNGQIAVIDSGTDTVRTHFALPVPNPQNEFAQLPNGDLLIAAQSFSDATHGCIVDITPGTTPTSACAIMNADLGGTANHIAIAGGQTPYVWTAVSSFDFTMGFLWGWNASTKTLDAAQSAGSNEMIEDVAACPDGSIIAADGTMNATGLRVFTPGAGGATERTTGALDFGLPPGFGNGLVCYDP